MISYISVRKHVQSIIRTYATKGQIIFVTNRIMIRLRDRRILYRDVKDLVLSVDPLPHNSSHRHGTVIELDSGLMVYFAVNF